MGLLDYFNKKNTEFPENEFEETLMKASSDPSFRNDFYMKLLYAELYVITADNEGLPEGRHVVESGKTVQLVTFPNGEIPVFSSKNRIFDKGVIHEQVNTLGMKGIDLFRITRGATFILNPYSDYGKELLPGEIENLLSGKVFESVNEVELKKETEVLIGQPSQTPSAFIGALSDHFKTREDVSAAYMGAIKLKNDTRQPHLIIGIVTDGDIAKISRDVAKIAEMTLPPGEVVDFVQLENNAGLSDYFFTQTEPFFKKE